MGWVGRVSGGSGGWVGWESGGWRVSWARNSPRRSRFRSHVEAAVGEPALGLAEFVGTEPAAAGAADLLAVDEAGQFEHPQVLADGGEAHRERRRQFRHARRPGGEPFDHPPAAGIGEGVEDPVDRVDGLLKHVLQYAVR